MNSRKCSLARNRARKLAKAVVPIVLTATPSLIFAQSLTVGTFDKNGTGLTLASPSNNGLGASYAPGDLIDVNQVGQFVNGGTSSLISMAVQTVGSSITVTAGAIAFDEAIPSGKSIAFDADSSSSGTFTAGTLSLSAGTLDIGQTLPSGATTNANDLITITSNVDGLVEIGQSNYGTVDIAVPTIGGNFDVASNGTLEFGPYSSIVGTGSIGITGAGTVVIDAPMSLFTTAGGSGGFTVTSGTLDIQGSNSLNFGNATTTTLAGGAINFLSNGTVLGASHPLVLANGGGTINVSTGTMELEDLISGTGRITKTGPGTLLEYSAFNGQTSTFSGGFTIDAGTLQIGSTTDLGYSVGNNTIINGGTLAWEGIGTTTPTTSISAGTGRAFTLDVADSDIDVGTLAYNSTACSLTLQGSMGGTGGLLKTGVGTLILTGTNTFNGAETVAGGVLSVGGAVQFGATPTSPTDNIILSGGILEFTSSNSGSAISANRSVVLGNGALGGVGTIDVTAAHTITLGGLLHDSGGSGSLCKIDTGTLVLNNGSSTYSGGTVVNAGALTGAVPGAFGTGSILVNPTGTSGTSADTATLIDNDSIASTAAVTVNTNSLTAIGLINFDGPTPTIASLSGTGAVALSNPAGSGGTALTIGNSGSATFSGVISDLGSGAANGSLTVTGSGTVVLAGTSTYGGSTIVNGGLLDVTGALTNSATVNVNNAAGLILDGAAALPSTAVVNVGSLASTYINNSQTIASLASAGNATFSVGTSIVGTGNGIGTGAGGGSTSGGISGTGTLTVKGTANLYAANITQSVLNIGATNTVTIADSAAPANASSVSVLTDINNSGTLDLNNNDLIVTDSTQYSTIKALINAAADGGAWDQAGITSSSARANTSTYGLGYAPASTIGTSTFDGVTLAGTETIVKYTLLGDTQLRGAVGIGDYDTVLSNYGAGTDWSQGNFHYSGVVGIGDYDDVLSNYGAHPAGNLVTNPALTHSLSPALSLSPDAAKSDLKLEVNTTTGDVYLEATTSVAFAGYTISDPSAHLLAGSTSPDPAKLLSVAPGNGGNTNPYETGTTYINWFKISETSIQLSEGQNNNGFANHSSRDDTINIPAGGTIDFGDIYNTAVNNQDISFDFAEAGTTPTNGPAYYGAEVDYVGGVATPEPGSVSLLALGMVGMLARRRRRGR